MCTHHALKLTIAMAVAGTIACTAIPATGAPLSAGATQFKSAVTSDIEQVRWRGHRGGGGGAVIGGIAAGMLLGGLIASSPYYGPPGYYGAPGYYGGPVYRYGYRPDGWEAYCFSRYRSFDPYSGTYMGYHGVRHPCR